MHPDLIGGALLAAGSLAYSVVLWRRDRSFDHHADQAIALTQGEGR